VLNVNDIMKYLCASAILTAEKSDMESYIELLNNVTSIYIANNIISSQNILVLRVYMDVFL